MLNLKAETYCFQESLEDINFEGNNITEIGSGTFLGLPNLKNVNLKANLLKTLPQSSLKMANSLGK